MSMYLHDEAVYLLDRQQAMLTHATTLKDVQQWCKALLGTA